MHTRIFVIQRTRARHTRNRCVWQAAPELKGFAAGVLNTVYSYRTHQQKVYSAIQDRAKHTRAGIFGNPSSRKALPRQMCLTNRSRGCARSKLFKALR